MRVHIAALRGQLSRVGGNWHEFVFQKTNNFRKSFGFGIIVKIWNILPERTFFFQWYVRMSAGTYRRTETTAELRRGKLARVCCQVQFVRTENSSSRQLPLWVSVTARQTFCSTGKSNAIQLIQNLFALTCKNINLVQLLLFS